MFSNPCFLCGEPLDRDITEIELPTEISRHTECLSALSKAAKRRPIQEILRAGTKPSYLGASDELETRNNERWNSIFGKFFKTDLPLEIIHHIGSFCRHGSLARDLTLEDTVQRAASILDARMPVPEAEWRERFFLYTSMTILMDFRNDYDSTYISGLCRGEHGRSNVERTICLDDKVKWTYLVVELDVGGCRRLSLYPGSFKLSTSIWYRLIPRSITDAPRVGPRSKYFELIYMGGILRDLIDPEEPNAPLFDHIPSDLKDLLWFKEQLGNTSPRLLPRMMRRRLFDGPSAITVAHSGSACLDLHFHYRDSSRDQAFYKSLEKFTPAPDTQRVDLLDNEQIVAVAVRHDTNTASIVSTSSLLVWSFKLCACWLLNHPRLVHNVLRQTYQFTSDIGYAGSSAADSGFAIRNKHLSTASVYCSHLHKQTS